MPNIPPQAPHEGTTRIPTLAAEAGAGAQPHPSAGARILLVDDNPAIHVDFRKILGGNQDHAALEATEALLFGAAPKVRPQFSLHSAYQGAQAVEAVRAALAAGMPFALAFVDMRMPPGIDGMETIEQMWRVDPRLQVVICTAFSEHPWHEVLERLQVGDRLLVVKKPFDLIEVLQLARTLTIKWALARQAERRDAELEQTLLQLRRSEAALRQAVRDLESFAHSAAHDLESPLWRIAAFAQLLAQDDGTDPASAAHCLAQIRSNAAQGQALIQELQLRTQTRRLDLQELGATTGTHPLIP
ncbi:MAG TPA: response regulator [Ramlibacter sp.]|nr:response regulator [Ramlibacter sp.]